MCIVYPLGKSMVVSAIVFVFVSLSPLSVYLPGIGMVVSAIGIVVAGVVEIYRKEAMNEPGGSHNQTLAGETFTASSMSVMVQIPQFAIIGVSEIFTSITSEL